MGARNKEMTHIHKLLKPFSVRPITVNECIEILKPEIETSKPNIANAISRAKKQGIRVDKIGHNADTHFYIPRESLRSFGEPIWFQMVSLMDAGDWFTAKELAGLLEIRENTVRQQLASIRNRHGYPMERRKKAGNELEYRIIIKHNEEI